MDTERVDGHGARLAIDEAISERDLALRERDAALLEVERLRAGIATAIRALTEAT